MVFHPSLRIVVDGDRGSCHSWINSDDDGAERERGVVGMGDADYALVSPLSHHTGPNREIHDQPLRPFPLHGIMVKIQLVKD
jgi:hypothetical protein